MTRADVQLTKTDILKRGIFIREQEMEKFIYSFFFVVADNYEKVNQVNFYTLDSETHSLFECYLFVLEISRIKKEVQRTLLIIKDQLSDCEEITTDHNDLLTACNTLIRACKRNVLPRAHKLVENYKTKEIQKYNECVCPEFRFSSPMLS